MINIYIILSLNDFKIEYTHYMNVNWMAQKFYTLSTNKIRVSIESCLLQYVYDI